jgi:hypothetical protein
MADERDDKLKDDRLDNDVLGIAGSPVPKAPGDPTTEHDADSVAQRRARMRQGEGEGRLADREDDSPGGGATGIDMGAGGEGTHIKTR